MNYLHLGTQLLMEHKGFRLMEKQLDRNAQKQNATGQTNLAAA